MTKKEISKLLNYSLSFIHKIFRLAAKSDCTIGKNIKAKNNTSTVTRTVDYSLEECFFALDFLPLFTPMQKQVLKENFIYRNILYDDKRKKEIKFSRSARLFLFLFQNTRGNVRVCATCSYLCARKHNIAGAKFKPFCTFSNCFISKAKPKRDIYKDRCELYTPSKTPLIFNECGIANVNSFGIVVNSTLGIPNELFTTKRTKDITLLKEI